MLDPTRHPCFNASARQRHGRIHLAVAPACNVQCNFCDRKFACLNENRPGVTAAVLSPVEALEQLDMVTAQRDDIAVVGIAGPGDPFANITATLTTLHLVREKYPDMLLCVSTNGLDLSGCIDELADLRVSHVTVTVNGVDPAVVCQVYAWIRVGDRYLTGATAALTLIARQAAAIRELAGRGIVVKVNTIVIPGVNEHHVAEISRAAASWGAHVQNCIPLLPVANTRLWDRGQPSPAAIHQVRDAARQHIPQVSHCTRCRADACGLLGEETSRAGEIPIGDGRLLFASAR